MQIKFSKIQVPNPEQFIRRCGYGKMIDRRTGQTSYARRLTHAGFYPRFHVYIVENAGQVTINLHLDQKAPRYEGVAAHSGEYDGQVVENEARRIEEVSRAVEPVAQPLTASKQRRGIGSWFSKFIKRG